MTDRTTIIPVLTAELSVEGDTMPVFAYLIDHPDGRVLVDTGLTAPHPLVDDMAPRPLPEAWEQVDPATVDLVVNTHLHFDHAGGNHLFAGRPIHAQRAELDDALTLDDYTIREWIDAPGIEYVAVDGELELLPGIRLLPAPGHTRGSQIVVVDLDGRVEVIAGDTAVFHAELDEPTTEGQRLIRSLEPAAVWLAHTHEPWRPTPGV